MQFYFESDQQNSLSFYMTQSENFLIFFLRIINQIVGFIHSAHQHDFFPPHSMGITNWLKKINKKTENSEIYGMVRYMFNTYFFYLIIKKRKKKEVFNISELWRKLRIWLRKFSKVEIDRNEYSCCVKGK